MSFKKYVSNLQSCQDYIFFSHRQVSPTTIELEVNERVCVSTNERQCTRCHKAGKIRKKKYCVETMGPQCCASIRTA